MKTPFRNIYNILKLNRFIVLSCVIGASSTCIFSILMVLKLHKETVDRAFVVNTEGNVIPLKMVSQKENLEVEALAHLQLFHNYFYGLDASNYQQKLEKALWLGNSSVDELYRQKKAEGFYNRLLQYSLVQKTSRIESQIDLKEEPYSFRTRIVLEINRGKVTDAYELITSGKLIHVDRNFPNNTHGLLITEFFEKSLRKLEKNYTEELNSR
ncbi:conjugal transfer protein TraK [Euzebyella marina]|uniref:Conjugal transfer protein TraK n=2 Tax=Bacteroidota TaxID=976 RepID=A0A3G2L5J4_9FLAO|nr:conjugal transfer protein TraK [Euzebyella marina]AYN67545.1 conjugal transfer protein TraK [Euzebyella marina]MAU70550.1 conjugal transfer protein TraK [Pseudozobellia sp.]MBC7000457.1 conjugal transfer protein TraK [Cytophaga sp. FL35]MBG48038.1 conjugal transfer protein TraK [Pseudozobellia sp.]